MIVSLARALLPKRSLRYLDRRYRYNTYQPRHQKAASPP